MPSRRVSVALRVPTMQGTPSSRLTIAAWHVMPPPSVTSATGAPQHRNPVGVRHRRDEHLALPQRFPFRRRAEDANPSAHSSGRGTEPPQKHTAGGTGRLRGGLGGQRGDRPRLHEERAAAGDRPLNVLGGAIVRLDPRTE